MTTDLMTDFASLVTDLRRLEWDNTDPMRFSKRSTKRLVQSILESAVREATTALCLVEAIEDDAKRMAEAAVVAADAPAVQAQGDAT